MKKFISLIILSLCLLSFAGCASLWNPYSSDFDCPEPYKGKCGSMQQQYKDSVTGMDEKAKQQELQSRIDPKTSRSKAPGSENGTSECKSCKNSNQVQSCKGKDCLSVNTILDEDSLETMYKTEQYREITSLIHEPKTPVIAQPEIVRVLYLGYADNDGDTYFSYRWSYFVIQDHKWILDPSAEIR